MILESSVTDTGVYPCAKAIWSGTIKRSFTRNPKNEALSALPVVGGRPYNKQYTIVVSIFFSIIPILHYYKECLLSEILRAYHLCHRAST